ncbi:hypothetical protein WJX74_008786 [Apatococcus lobatus]|uniref:Uncharacterized protein n=1 Tax=Apatococcus lobatus TaxID=904363 RepID=A0AAW1RUE6_9CHLO
MFGSSDKSSKGYGRPEEETGKRSLNDLSSSLRDVEVPFATAGPPSGFQRLKKELQQNWWLWGSIAFAVILIGSLVIFRNSLYTKTGYGLPFLAVKENAAEACATQCKDEASALQSGKEKLDEAKLREMYDECYTKCVAEETKEVAEERESFKKEEEQFEKDIEAKEQKKTGTTGDVVDDIKADTSKTAATLQEVAATGVASVNTSAAAAPLPPPKVQGCQNLRDSILLIKSPCTHGLWEAPMSQHNLIAQLRKPRGLLHGRKG